MAAASVDLIRKRLHARAQPSRVAVLQSFFKTGPGQYADGDVFIGVTVPNLRQVCRECVGASLKDIASLVRSAIHEERLLALLLLVEAFERGDAMQQRDIYRFYLSNTRYINNWDLVDASAPQIVGAYLFERSRAPLRRLARSRSLWERRVAIVSTHHFIRQGDLEDTWRIADLLLEDDHDLIHKAVGWMLREAGKRNDGAVRQYLKTRYQRMPRTMLRYAIERFPEGERKKYLRGAI